MLFLRREHSAGIKETLRISKGCGRQACRKDNESRWTAGRLHGPDMQQCSEDTEVQGPGDADGSSLEPASTTTLR